MNRAPVIKLATTALHAAMRDDWPAATTAVQAINDRHGGRGLMAAILAWCDTAILKMTGSFTASGSVAVAFQAVETGEIGGADDVPAEVRWAGRLIAARAADDEPTFNALIESVPSDPKAMGAHVARLLEMVAINIRAAS